MNVFTKPLPDGRTACLTPLITATGAVSYTAVDESGNKLASGWLSDAVKTGVPPESIPAGHTHLIAAVEPLWFTPAEVVQITALGAEAKAAFDSSERGQEVAEMRRAHAARQAEARQSAAAAPFLESPEVQPLVHERAALVAAAEAVLDVDADQRTRAHDDEGLDPGTYYREQAGPNSAAYSRACETLAQFDAAHPEVAAALEEENKTRMRRFLDLD